MDRRDPRLEIATEAIERLIPGATPAYMTVTVTETLPGTSNPHGTPHRHEWSGTPGGLAEVVCTALHGRPSAVPESPRSPLAQAEDAKRSRDLVGEVGALMSGYSRLTTASWYPVRPGDLVHVHYEGVGESAAYGETYLVSAGAGAHDGFLSMQLLAHTLPDGTPYASALVGCFAVDEDPDPLAGLWMEAGPHRLTVVRDGRPVHIGGAR